MLTCLETWHVGVFYMTLLKFLLALTSLPPDVVRD